MTLEDIKAAVDAGQTVHWANAGYVVQKDRLGQYLITYVLNGSCIGLTLTNSAGRDIPVRWIGEQHVREDCQGRIPSMADRLPRIQPEPWMANGHIDRHAGSEPCGDPRVAWASEVAAGRTVLGLKDWMAARATQATQGA